MVDMNAVRTLSGVGFVPLIEIVSSLIVVIVGLVVTYRKAREALQNWRSGENAKDDEKKTVKERLAALEKEDKEQIERLSNIDATLQNIVASLEVMAEDNRQATLASMRTILYDLHARFVEKGSVTMAQREMFDACSKIYLSRGGNSVFKSHIIPEVEALPVQG